MLQGYREDLGYALLPPRPPGGRFWPEIAAGVAAQREAAEQAARVAEAEAAAADGANADAPAGGEAAAAPAAAPAADQPSVPAPATAAAAAAGVQPQQQAAGKAQPQFFAVVSSFAAEEESVQAARLGARYGVPVTTFTDLVLDAGELASERPGEQFEHGKRTFGDFLYEELIGWELEGGAAGKDESAATQRPYAGLPVEQLEPLITRAIGAALRQPAYANGVIIQGLRCEFAPAHLATRALLMHLGLEKVSLASAAGGAEVAVRKGDTPLWFVALNISMEDAEARRRAKLTPEQAEAEQAAEATTAQAAATAGKSRPKSASKPAAPAKGRKGAMEAPKEVVIPEGISRELGTQWLEHDAARATAKEELLAEHPDSAVKVRSWALGVQQMDPSAVHDAITGVRFNFDKFECAMPAASSDTDRIAPPYILQVVRKPAPRKARKAGSLFKLLSVLPPDPEAAAAAAAAAMEAARPASGKGRTSAAAKGKKGEAPPAPPPEASERIVPCSRWVLQPGESAAARLEFTSAEVADVESKLALEVYSGDNKLEVPVRATCARPSISADPKVAFTRCVKARPGPEGEAAVRRQWIINRKRFEFGPLLVGASASGEQRPTEHSTVVKLKNDGRFDVNAVLVMQSAWQPPSATDAAAAGVKGGKAAPAAKPKGGKGGDESASVQQGPFIIEPASVAIKQGETAEVTVWCFPTEVGDVTDTLMCIMENQPQPVQFPMAACGTKTAVTVRLESDPEPIEGSPEAAAAADEAAKAAAAAAAKPGAKGGKGAKAAELAVPAQPANKLLARGVVFQRMVPGRKEVQGFAITNTSRLPVTWALVATGGGVKLADEFTFFFKDDKGRLQRIANRAPMGTLKAFDKTSVFVEYESKPLTGDDEAKGFKEVAAELTLEVRDPRKALAQTEAIKLHGETYVVKVDLACGGGGDCLDFGKLRVRHPAVHCISSFRLIVNSLSDRCAQMWVSQGSTGRIQ